MGTQSNTLPVLPQKIITAQDDSGLDNIDAQIHFFSDSNPPTPGQTHTLTLPCAPGLGQSHRIVAATAAVNIVDSNGTPITRNGLPFANPLPLGSSVVITFTKDPAGGQSNGCGCGGSDTSGGTWVVSSS